MTIEVQMILARSKNNVIGLNGKIPWYIPEDFKHFRKTTMSHAIIMGRITFEEIKQPLMGRYNIVLSSIPFDIGDHSNLYITDDLNQALKKVKEEGIGKVFIAGGSGLYNKYVDLVDTVIVTEIDIEVPYSEDDDVTKFDYEFKESEWTKVDVVTELAECGTELNFITYKRVKV